MTTDEVIEGEAADVTPQRAVAVVPPPAIQSSLIVGGTAGLALMSDEEFERNLTALSTLRARVDRVKKALMKDDVDYGVIPGTGTKPALLKPGAETLLRTFGLADSYVIERIVGDGETTPDYEVLVHARIHIGDTSGPIVAEGIGSANTWETKHRYRGQNGRTCPNCGKDNVIHSKPPRTGWWCGTRDGGCGASFEEEDARIKGQPDPGKAENPDPWDLANTVTKMGKKRALVDGILTATGTSGIFTQDEDAPGHRGGQNAPGGAGGTGAQSGATSGGNAVPDGPDGLKGVVEKAPDGLRRVKVTRHGGTEHDKVEIVFKVSNRRHTAILLDAAAHRGLALEVQPGEVLRVIGGAVEEIQWSDDATKPKKKELWGATDVAVLREGAWILGSTLVPELPLALHADGDGAAETVRLLAAPDRGTDAKGRHYARFRGAAEGTGEIIEAVLGEKAPGELDAMIGPADDPEFTEGDTVVLTGTWQKGWLVATLVGYAQQDGRAPAEGPYGD